MSATLVHSASRSDIAATTFSMKLGIALQYIALLKEKAPPYKGGAYESIQL